MEALGGEVVVETPYGKSQVVSIVGYLSHSFLKFSDSLEDILSEVGSHKMMQILSHPVGNPKK